MFEATLQNASTFKKVIEAIKDLVSEGKFQCSSSGMAMQSMDGSHVCLVSVIVTDEAFDPFRCDRNIVLGVKIENLSKILKCSNNDDEVFLQNEDNADLLKFRFTSPKQDKISEFDLKLMDIDAEQLGIPDTRYAAIITLPSAEFARICRDLSVLSDSITVTCAKQSVMFSAEGDVANGRVVLNQTEDIDKENEKVSVCMEEPVMLTFAVRYLNSFTKASSVAPSVTISMSKDTPLAVEYKIKDFGCINYYLAPKVDED